MYIIYMYMHLIIYNYIYIYYGRGFSKGMALAFGGMLVVSEECRAF